MRDRRCPGSPGRNDVARLFVSGQLQGVIEEPESEKYTSGRAEYAVLEYFYQEVVWVVRLILMGCAGACFRPEMTMLVLCVVCETDENR